MKNDEKSSVIIMDLEDIYYLTGFIICDIFLFWYLPTENFVEIIIDIIIMVLCMVGVYAIIQAIYDKNGKK